MRELRDENCCEVEAKTYIKAEIAKGHINSERVDWRKKSIHRLREMSRNFVISAWIYWMRASKSFPWVLSISGLLLVQILNWQYTHSPENYHKDLHWSSDSSCLSGKKQTPTFSEATYLQIMQNFHRKLNLDYAKCPWKSKVLLKMSCK